jgi:hypothetical protein
MKTDFLIIKNALAKDLCKFIALEFEMMETLFKQLYPAANLADDCDNTFARYSPLMMEALSVWLSPQVESAVNKKLYPTYSYARIYYNGSELKKHRDRKSSEVTVSVCLEKDCEWPLYIKNNNGDTHEIHLDVGDAVVYSGRDHEHWRNPLSGSKQIQAFLQYVDANGDSALLKWDTRPVLGMPFNYANVEVQNEIKHL